MPARRTKKDIECLIRSVNGIIPQVSKACKRELKGDYAANYGGWLIYYYDENCKAHNVHGHFRIPHREAYRLLEGIMFSLNSF